MKRTKLSRLAQAVIICISYSILVIACKKGDNGPAGATGPAGPKGDSGVAGTANVMYSAWQFANSVSDTTIDATSMDVEYIPAPPLDSSILTRGAVLVYFSLGGTTYPLPYTSNAGGTGSTVNFLPLFKKIAITRFAFDNSLIGFSSALQFRYIIIPGGVAVSKSNIAKKGQASDTGLPAVETLKKMSYDEICRTLSIQP